MAISISKLTVIKNKNSILNGIDLDIPRKGITAIIGASGSGKSTFLNCISGVESYHGRILYDGVDITRMNEKEHCKFRIENIGQVYQHFNLYDSLTVKANISLSLDAVCNLNPTMKSARIMYSLKTVGMEKYGAKLVRNLSGGEKQRVAIARAIINNPKYLIADEPTGSLDKENTRKIMYILQQISNDCLVILVTHDINLAKNYASYIVSFKDGKIDASITNKVNKVDSKIKLNIRKDNKTNSLSIDNAFKISISHIKIHKFRTIFTSLFLSLAMLSVGLSISASSLISSNVVSSYGSLIETDKAIVNYKKETTSKVAVATDINNVQTIKLENPTYCEDIGICYYADFESIFEDKNTLSFTANEKHYVIPNFSARNINDFKWFDEEKITTFPSFNKGIGLDDVILGLTFAQVKYICSVISIKQSIESLGAYIERNEFNIVFDFANYNWEYEDQQILNVKSVALVSSPCFYHINHKWNEYLFEERMRFPIRDNFTNNEHEPWSLAKGYYLLVNDTDSFLDAMRFNQRYMPFVFEIADKKFFQTINEKSYESKRILVFDDNNYLSPIFSNYIMDIENTLYDPLYGSAGGYAIYSTALMSGFSNYAFFGANEEIVLEISDLYEEFEPEERNVLEGENILIGHYSQTHSNGVIFEPISSDEFNKIPLNYFEIVVSSGISKKLFNGDSEGKKLFFYSRNWNDEVVQLQIVGEIDDDGYKIYHSNNWTISFFQFVLGYSAFDLICNSISFSLSENFNYELAKSNLEKAFPKLTLEYPLFEIVNSANNASQYITLFLVVISLFISIVGLLIMLQVSSISISEFNKDIAIARLIGFTKGQADKILKCDLALKLLISFFLAVFEYLIVYLFTIKGMGINSLLTVIISSTSAMILLCFLLFVIVLTFVKFATKKLNPIDALRK